MRPSIVAGEVRTALFDYLRTTFNFSDAAFEAALFEFLEAELVKGPWVDLKLPFRQPTNQDGPPPLSRMPPFPPYAHQLRAFERLTTVGGRSPESTLVTTGTGSGKTECFLWPILDHCLRHHEDRGIKAIILYPMNALASDQAKRIAEELSQAPFAGKVRAGLYVGGKGSHSTMTEEHLIDDRKILRQAPPDILLTNYRMLDFLLLRPEDQPLWARDVADSLRFLVLDELHTYDGAQATDVACLIRRLKRRLAVGDGKLACVGTSATLGSRGGDDPSAPLRDFAQQVFDEAFPLESVVTEDRQSRDEALGRLDAEADDPAHRPLERLPRPGDAEALRPRADTEAWLLALARLFLVPEGAPADAEPEVLDAQGRLDRVRLGDALARHTFLRATLRALEGGPLTVDALLERLATLDPVFGELDDPMRAATLDGLLTLVGEAQRTAPGDRKVPFLQLQVQLWVRELRRLLQRIPMPGDPKPVFQFADVTEADATSEAKALPVAHCRHCGGHGLASSRKAGARRLGSGPGQIGGRWLDNHPDARYVRLLPEPGDAPAPTGEPGDLVPLRLGPERLDLHAETAPRFGPRIELAPAERPKRFTATCPECGEQESLRILGARGPSLLSVAVGHLFLTDQNADKKLISFVDRVQDAAHLAGFFGARTYRFNLRAALQGALLAADDGAGVPLTSLSRGLYAFAQDRLPSEGAVVATLMPPDLKARPAYRDWHDTPEGPALAAMTKDLKERLVWEVTREFGLGSGLGRTLERTGAACAHPDGARLDQAAQRLAADLKEQAVLQMADAAPSVEACRRFLAGLCQRLRLRGGVYSPLLNGYVANGGNTYLLYKKSNPLFSPFGPRSPAPRFLTSAFKPKTFDSRYSSPSQPSWLRVYAAHALGSHVRDEGINAAVEKALNRLTEAEVVKTKRAGTDFVYGLDPKHLRVTARVAHVGCETCRRGQFVPEDEAARWAGGACLHYRCPGTLSVTGRPPERFYRRIYGAGTLQRIFSAEHTGLLERQPREALETRFKRGAAAHPEAENVLVATPTLEMGIDIGDLSAVALAGVPPGAANYLQRVGRAGRKTGRAFTLTLAEAKPHDTYFFESPAEMLAGEVRPPGCYLDAPEMLKRQLVAYAMDRWAEAQDSVHDIPRYTSAVLGQAGEAGFLGQFLAYWAKHRAEILEGFEALFDEVAPRHRAAVRALAEGDALAEAVRGAFRRVEEDEKELNLLIRRVSDRIRAIEKDPSLAEDADRTKQELESDRSTLRSQRDGLTRKYPLNTLTDAGVLPNYAFPEPGVTLTSKLRRTLDEAGPDGRKKTKTETFEYQRPASSALRELAPFNTFYAEGRKVRITEVDIGTKERSRVEAWRFCPSCAHMALEAAQEAAAACPRCGHAGWADSGQVRHLVRFVRSMAFADEIQALVEDDGDDRQNQSYATQALIDVGEENWDGAVAAPAAMFGVEALKHQRLREVNFGFDEAVARNFEAYAHRFPEAGFTVCAGCGRVKPPQGEFKGELRHANWCTYAKNEALKEKTTDVALYREIESEAVRIMVPALVSDVPRKLASFQAALDLGFREYFRGRPQHLLTEAASEPVAGSDMARRNYVVVFDAVPGGTGYLGELMPEIGGSQDRGLLKILSMALQTMRQCGCRRQGLDGCHRCIRGFQPNHRLPNVSRRVAETLIEKEILAYADQLEPVPTLSEVSIDSRLESELELRFVQRLEAWAERQGGRQDRVLHKGHEAWELRFEVASSSQLWRLEPQVLLGPAQGVDIACKPDFVLRPLVAPDGAQPVAVFCDGFRYHVQPDRPTSRLADDVRKRRAILASGGYRVWGLSWRDLDPSPESPEALIPESELGNKTVATRMQGDADTHLLKRGAFDLLTRYLLAPDTARWRRLATLHLGGALASGPKWLAPDSADQVLTALRAQRERPNSTASLVTDRPDPLGRSFASTYAEAAMSWRLESLAKERTEDLKASLRLYDTAEERRAEGFEDTWRGFLHAWAWLQFVPGLEVTTTELLAEEASAPPEPAATTPTSDLVPEAKRAELAEVLDLIVDDDARLMIEVLATWGEVPLPEPGWDAGPDGEVLDMIELAWPDQRLGVVIDGQEAGRAAFERLGWTVHDLESLGGAQKLYTLLTGQPVPTKDDLP